MSPTSPLLDVRNLHVGFDDRRGFVYAVRGINFSVDRAERVGIVGESGSGKSVTAHSILRLLPKARASGEIWFDGQDLNSLSNRAIRQVRGRRIGMIFQDPMTALDPVRTIGSQVVEGGRHRGLSKRQARDETLDLLAEIGIPDVRRRFDDYPHQLSGGMRQRVVIAAALIGEPELLIADEPTTALDVLVQARLLELIWRLSESRQMAVLLISHDLALVGGFAERTVVMYAGQIRETAPSLRLFTEPAHPYTEGLLRLAPRLHGGRPTTLQPIPGRPPSPVERSRGCAFAPRCEYVVDGCRTDSPQLVEYGGPEHLTACFESAQVASKSRDSAVTPAVPVGSGAL